MSAEQFLNTLETSGAVTSNVVSNLRSQIANSGVPVSAEQVAKLLVDKGKLDAGHAQQLLAQQSGLVMTSSVDDDLGLTPLDDDGLMPLDNTGHAVGAGTKPARQHQSGLSPVANTGGLTPLSNSGGLTPLDDLGGLQPLSAPGDSGLQPLGGGGFDNSFGGDLMTDGMMGAGGFGGAAAQSQTEQSPHTQGDFRGKKVEKHWQNKMWPFVGGCTLLLLILLVAWLIFVLTKGDAVEMLERAEKAYNEPSYSAAIEEFDKFIRAFPDHEKVSHSRVRIVLARLWMPVSSKDWVGALEAAQTHLPTIHEEDALSEAREELRSILPSIAEGFAQRAMDVNNTAEKQAQLDLLAKAMELVNKSEYISSTDRRENPTIARRLEKIEDDKSLVERDIKKDLALKEALDKIEMHVNAGETAEARNVREELLRDYFELLTNPDLKDAVLKIADRERSLVNVQPTKLMATTEDHPRMTKFTVVAVNRIGQAIDTLKGQMVVVLAEGSAYGLNASTGEVLWRRPVGYETTFFPQPVSQSPGADTILVNSRLNELMRIKTKDGSLVWRLEIGEPFTDPIITPDSIFVTTESDATTQRGKLIEVNSATGQPLHQAEFPQQLFVGPGVYENLPYLYEVSEKSNLYVLNRADLGDEGGALSCREVFYLGHKSGTVVVPPLLVRGHILIAENQSENTSLLHVLVPEKRGLKLKRVQDPIRLSGNVTVPMAEFGRQIMVVTDLGQIAMFEIHLGDENPLAKIIEQKPSLTEPMTTFPYVDPGKMWYAGKGLRRFDIQVASGRLELRWFKFPNDTFVGPSKAFGNVLITSMRRAGIAGVSVSAIDSESGEPLWRTDLGVHRVGPPILHDDRKKIISISAQGNLFEVDGPAIQAGFINAPAARPNVTEQRISLIDQVDLAGGTRVLSGKANSTVAESKRLITYNSNRASNPLRMQLMEVPAGAATAKPTAFQDGILMPWSGGQVLLIDAESGKDKVLPFQPPQQPGNKVLWRQPAVLDGGEEFVIVDDRRRIYRVGIADLPQPHLKSAAEGNIGVDIVSPLASIGNLVFGVADVAGKHVVATFDKTSLVMGSDIPIDGRVNRGPERVGESVCLTTDTGRFYCIAADGTVRWNVALDHGSLAGAPLEHDGDLILTSKSGAIWRIDGETGAAVGNAVITDEPFGSGAIMFNGLLWLYGADGTLHAVEDIVP